MFVKAVPNTKGKAATFFCYLVESYRENGKIKHHTIRNFGLLEEDQVPFLKAMYAKKKPRIVYDDEAMVNSGRDISADVYVAGHHGSRTSTTEPFLDVVSPTYHVPEKR
jgi:hypothetical protein